MVAGCSSHSRGAWACSLQSACHMGMVSVQFGCIKAALCWSLLQIRGDGAAACRGSILCALITQHFYGILSSPCIIHYYLHYYLFNYLHYYFSSYLLLLLDFTCLTFLWFEPQLVAQTTIDLNKGSSSSNTPILDRNGRGMFSHELNDVIMNQ